MSASLSTTTSCFFSVEYDWDDFSCQRLYLCVFPFDGCLVAHSTYMPSLIWPFPLWRTLKLPVFHVCILRNDSLLEWHSYTKDLAHFKFQWNLNYFENKCYQFYLYPQYTRVTASLHPHRNSILLAIFMFCKPNGLIDGFVFYWLLSEVHSLFLCSMATGIF